MTEERDPAMVNAKRIADASGMSLQQIGEAMGYPPELARQSIWQFLNRTNDPRLGMLRKFATAVGVDVRDLI